MIQKDSNQRIPMKKKLCHIVEKWKPNKTNKEALGVEGYKLQHKECEREEMNSISASMCNRKDFS